MRLESNDRRWNVGHRQENKLLKPGEDFAVLRSRIEKELQDFANYLKTRPADPMMAATPLENEAKRQLQDVTQTAGEEVAEALRAGNLEYFFEHRPLAGRQPPTGSNADIIYDLAEPKPAWFDGTQIFPRESFRDVLKRAIHLTHNSGKHVLIHDDLFAIFELFVGDMPNSKAKLNKRLKNLSLHIAKERVGEGTVRGIHVAWIATPEQLASWMATINAEERRWHLPPVGPEGLSTVRLVGRS